MEEQSVAGAAARGVGAVRRVRGGSGGGADEEEEEYERSADLAAGGGFVDPGPSVAPATIAALFYPSLPPPQIVAGVGVLIGRNTAGDVAGHWNYNVSGEVAHLKRFELHLEKWEQDLKDREDALDRREREVEDAAEREAAYLQRLELHLQNRGKFLDDREEALNRLERRIEEALNRRERGLEEAEALNRRLEQLLQALKVQEERTHRAVGIEGPSPQQPERKKNDDTCNWGLGVVTVTLVVNVLVFLRHIQTLLPHGYFTGVVCALALLWSLSSVILSNKVSGRYRRKV